MALRLQKWIEAAYCPRWNQLRHRLIFATKDRGARAQLARMVRVTRASVSQWLAGDNLPAAETTLHLLEWVAAREAENEQKKRAGRAVESRPALRPKESK